MNDNNDRVYGVRSADDIALLTQADRDIARLTGVAGVDIIEHKKRVAAGDFKPGFLKPCSVIVLG